MNQRVLITGVRGFTGRHLARRLAGEPGAEVYGIGTADETLTELAAYFVCDLTDAARVETVIDEVRPDAVYHLAGVTAGTTPEEIRDINERGFAHLCDSLRRSAVRRATTVRLLTVGSAAELGAKGVERLPATEESPCGPESPYGRTKHEVTRRALAEPTDGALRIVVARAFNLLGPGMGTHLALGRFAAQLAAIRRGEADALRCGNLASRRDFVDVRDAVDAYVRLGRQGRAGQLYNVSSGRSWEIGALLERMIALSGMDVPVVVDSAARRSGDLPDVYGDATKTHREVGWRATTPVERSIADLIEDVFRRDDLKRDVARQDDACRENARSSGATESDRPGPTLTGPHRTRAEARQRN